MIFWLQSMSRRGVVRIISFTLAALIAISAAAVCGSYTAVKYRTRLEYGYQRAISDLSTHVSNISTALNKSLYAGTGKQMSELAVKLTSDCGGAKSCLLQLPSGAQGVGNINKFLSQVGDFADSLSRQMGDSDPVTDEQYESLKTLSRYADDISESINDMIISADDGSGQLFADADRSIYGGNDEYAALSDGLQSTEDGFTDFPSLIYDGPFSDHLLKQTPSLTENEPEITKEEALKIAADFLQVPQSKLIEESDDNGNLPTFCFSFSNGYIAVSRNGGHVVYSHSWNNVGSQTLDPDQCIEAARSFLEEHGYADMSDSYYHIYDGVCTVNFAYKTDSVLCYTDLIKVGVAMDNGNVVSLDATGYIMNHHEREIPSAAIDEETARSVLSPMLTVRGSQLCLIPSGGQSELYCYEFNCTGSDDDEILVYINAESGSEEQIFILLKGDNGVLTI